MLNIPIYWTFRHSDLDAFGGLDDGSLASLKKKWSSEKLREVFDAMEWALSNASLDLSTLLPGLTYTDTQLRSYLRILVGQFSELLDSGRLELTEREQGR